MRLTVDEDGIGWIVFDLPGEKINKLSTPVMEALRDALDEAQRRGVKGLVFASDKPNMFIAGADVEEIAGITDPRIGAEKAAYGQAIFEAIARFPRPTAAVINGPCLGGGYELALACTWRIAENVDAVKVGLPEVRLGILPGFRRHAAPAEARRHPDRARHHPRRQDGAGQGRVQARAGGRVGAARHGTHGRARGTDRRA